MRYILISLIFVVTLLNADFKKLDGIALLVNGKEILNSELEKVMKTDNIDRETAKKRIVEETLIEEELSQRGVTVTEDDIDNELIKTSSRMRISLNMYKTKLAKQHKLAKIRNDIKRKVQFDKLAKLVVSENMNYVDESFLKNYYKTNLNKLRYPSKIEMTRYTTKDKIIANRLKLGKRLSKRDAKKVAIDQDVITPKDLPNELYYALAHLKRGQTSDVITAKDEFVVFKMKRRSDFITPTFEESRSDLIRVYTISKKEQILDNFFTNLKNGADVEYIEDIKDDEEN